jgi:ATPase subunit of ABC transporter with duplicated ATPase domains
VLLHSPTLLLLDEPANALDAAGLALLDDLLAEQGRTWVVATHDPARVEHLATERLSFA